MKLEYKRADGSSAGQDTFDSSYPTEIGKWEYFTKNFKIPADAVSARIHMRSQGIGTMYFDDLSIVGACTSEDKEKKMTHCVNAWRLAIMFPKHI